MIFSMDLPSKIIFVLLYKKAHLRNQNYFERKVKKIAQETNIELNMKFYISCLKRQYAIVTIRPLRFWNF